jgi:G:T/U-mismatch repair DNA glycosylase
MSEIESHPLEPFLPANASLLMLGSFPPPRKRWSMDFFYPNLQNDMWRIFGHLFFNDKNHFLLPDKASFCKEEIVTFLQEKGIALFDAATVVRRLQGNASDKFLEIIEPTDIRLLLKQLPQCQTIAATGQKAIDTIRLQVDADEPSVGRKVPFSFDDRDMHLYRMPSSSRAYPLALEKKAEYYLSMFKDLGIY